MPEKTKVAQFTGIPVSYRNALYFCIYNIDTHIYIQNTSIYTDFTSDQQLLTHLTFQFFQQPIKKLQIFSVDRHSYLLRLFLFLTIKSLHFCIDCVSVCKAGRIYGDHSS